MLPVISRKILYRTLPLLFGALLFSCQHIFPGEGQPTTIEYSFESIKSLSVDDLFDVVIVPDSLEKVVVEGGENQLRTVSLTFDNVEKRVSLTNTRRMRMLTGYSPIVVYVHTQSVEEIRVTVAAGIRFQDTLRVPQFYFRSLGDMANANLLIHTQNLTIENIDTNGKIVAEGVAANLSIFNRGLSIVDCSLLKTTTVTCRQYSLGDCHVKAGQELFWEIFRNGNIVQYKPVAVIEGRSFGTGKLIIIE